MSERGSLASKVHFILQLGFFTATSQFFNCSFDEVKNDVNFILQKYFENTRLQTNTVSKQTRHTNQMLVSKILKFQTDKSVIQEHLRKMLETKVRLSSNPVYLFHEVLCHSAEHKLMLLGCSSIQKLIGSIITEEEQRLGELLKKYLSHFGWKLIEAMISKDENEYVLTTLKKDPKSFKSNQIKAEIKNSALIFRFFDDEKIGSSRFCVANKWLKNLDIQGKDGIHPNLKIVSGRSVLY